MGNYMDRQESKLRTQLQGTGVSVTRTGDTINLVMPGNITFASGSSDLNASFFSVLGSVALVLKEYDKTTIDIAGYTDSTGSAQKNQLLSRQRAQTVGEFLRSKGIPGAAHRLRRLREQLHPVASNSTAQGRQQNRRVELTLTPVRQG